MLAILRESLLARLVQLSTLVNSYRLGEPDFVLKAIEFLESAETELLRLRSPLASLCSSERAKLIATLDGFRDSQLTDADRRPRRAARATAALAVSRVADAFRSKVHELDARLDQLREKVAQLIALASGANPIPLPPFEPRSIWLDQIWRNLGAIPEGRALHTYVSAQLGATDREYVLSEIVENALLGSTAGTTH